MFFWFSLVLKLNLLNFWLSFYPSIIFQLSWASFFIGFPVVLWIVLKNNTCFIHEFDIILIANEFIYFLKHYILYSVCFLYSLCFFICESFTSEAFHMLRCSVVPAPGTDKLSRHSTSCCPRSWGQMRGKGWISFPLVCRTFPWYLYFHRASLSLHPAWCPWVQRHSRKQISRFLAKLGKKSHLIAWG